MSVHIINPNVSSVFSNICKKNFESWYIPFLVQTQFSPQWQKGPFLLWAPTCNYDDHFIVI